MEMKAHIKNWMFKQKNNMLQPYTLPKKNNTFKMFKSYDKNNIKRPQRCCLFLIMIFTILGILFNYIIIPI